MFLGRGACLSGARAVLDRLTSLDAVRPNSTLTLGLLPQTGLRPIPVIKLSLVADGDHAQQLSYWVATADRPPAQCRRRRQRLNKTGRGFEQSERTHFSILGARTPEKP